MYIYNTGEEGPCFHTQPFCIYGTTYLVIPIHSQSPCGVTYLFILLYSHSAYDTTYHCKLIIGSPNMKWLTPMTCCPKLTFMFYFNSGSYISILLYNFIRRYNGIRGRQQRLRSYDIYFCGENEKGRAEVCT